MIVNVRCISVARILNGKDEGRYLYKFWQIDAKVTVDEMLLILDEADRYLSGKQYTINLTITEKP